jgi:ParB family chromosome partitioning protein
MSSKNMKFAADLAASVEPQPSSERVGRAGSSILNSRNNRLADLAAGSVVNNQQELVDPARCRFGIGIIVIIPPSPQSVAMT